MSFSIHKRGRSKKIEIGFTQATGIEMNDMGRLKGGEFF